MSERPRLVVAVLVGAIVICLSYAGQRLWDSVGEPPLGTVLRQATIPYFWRVGFAALHGLGAAVAVAVGLRAETARTWLTRAPWLVPAAVLPAALAMAWVP
jgi:hypothetical protein